MLYSDLGIVVLACKKALAGERGWPVTGQVAESHLASPQVSLFRSYVARTTRFTYSYIQINEATSHL